MAEAILQYRSAHDGHMFNTRGEAENHESLHKAAANLKTVITKWSPQYNSTLHADLVTKMDFAVAMRDALNKAIGYQRNKQKLKKK